MNEFTAHIQTLAHAFKKIHTEDKKPVRIISNLDTDGITAAAILSKTLAREHIPFSTSIIKQLNEDTINTLNKEPYTLYFFLDLGSNTLHTLERTLNKTLFILDHHYTEHTPTKKTTHHANPHTFHIDGTKDISAAGITYLFCKALNPKNTDLAHLALAGAIGDIQEHMGFTGLNALILNDALQQGTIEIKNTLRLYGVHSKPLHKVLEYTTNPYIPGVTGNEQGAIRFLTQLGISHKQKNTYTRLHHLTPEELEKFITAIELHKAPTSLKEPLVGPVFFLTHTDEETPADLREFSTLINSCGRMNYASLGIAVCMGDKKMSKKAHHTLEQYRKEIIDALTWFYEERKQHSTRIIEHPHFVIVNAGHLIKDTIIGTLTSLLAKSNLYTEGTIIMGCAYTLEDDIKASIRISGHKDYPIDLRHVITTLVNDIGGIAGGHKLAAGALIPQEHEDTFITKAQHAFATLTLHDATPQENTSS